jgi:hypothetical protein
MNTGESVSHQLQRAAQIEEPVPALYELTDTWRREGVGPDAIEPILRFIEARPDLDLGARGPLVHFVESLDRVRYEQELLASIARRPTFYTVGMVNALLNATREPDARRAWMAALQAALSSPATDTDTKDQIRTVLAFQSKGGVALA